LNKTALLIRYIELPSIQLRSTQYFSKWQPSRVVLKELTLKYFVSSGPGKV